MWMALSMGAPVACLGRACFTKTARSRPRHHEARRDGRHTPALAKGRWRFAHDGVERPAERAQTGEADIEAKVRHAAIGRAQKEHRPLDAAPLQVTVRRFAECRAEGAAEVRLGHFRKPREVRDVEWPSEGAVHRVSSAEHPAIALFYSAHVILYYRGRVRTVVLPDPR